MTKFMEKLYQITGYDIHNTYLTVTARYPISKEYIALPLTDQEIMEIAFVVVTSPDNSVEIYIDGSILNSSRLSPAPVRKKYPSEVRESHVSGTSYRQCW